MQDQKNVEKIDENDGKYQGIIERTRNLGYRFELPIRIDSKLHGKIKYLKGGKKKWLEGDTRIVLPSDRSSNVVIEGNSKEAVLATKVRLEKFLAPKQKLTHFLSIHFTDEEILSNFAAFKNSVLHDFEVHKSLLQSAEKLHLTVVMLALPDEVHKAKAIEALNACKEKFIDPVIQEKPLSVKVTGVGVFADENPTKATVLFGKVNSPELEQISNSIASYFEQQELIKLDRKYVQLHLTLINSSFFKDNHPEEATGGEGGAGRNFRNFRRKVHFDATGIIERFKDFDFGMMQVNEIQISQLDGRDPGCYYKSIGELRF